MFSRSLIAMTRPGHPWLMRIRSRPILLAALCGFVVALTVWFTNGLSWGTGYATTRLLLAGHGSSMTFGPAKFIATLATALSGAPGGIFAPSLSVGAGLGQLMAHFFLTSPAGAIVLPLFATALITDAVSAMICKHKLYHPLTRQFRPSTPPEALENGINQRGYPRRPKRQLSGKVLTCLKVWNVVGW